MKQLHKVSFILLAIGGLNWFLVGLFSWDVGAIFGGQAAFLSRLLYILVGLSAVYELSTHRQNCRVCGIKEESKSKHRDIAHEGMKA